MARAAQVCLVPHRETPMSRAMSPLKLYEYLGAGSPVVATDLPPIRGVSTGACSSRQGRHWPRRLSRPPGSRPRSTLIDGPSLTRSRGHPGTSGGVGPPWGPERHATTRGRQGARGRARSAPSPRLSPSRRDLNSATSFRDCSSRSTPGCRAPSGTSSSSTTTAATAAPTSPNTWPPARRSCEQAATMATRRASTPGSAQPVAARRAHPRRRRPPGAWMRRDTPGGPGAAGRSAVAPGLEDNMAALYSPSAVRRPCQGGPGRGLRRAGGPEPALGRAVTDPTAYTSAHIVDGQRVNAHGEQGVLDSRVMGQEFFLYSRETHFALVRRMQGLVSRFVPAARAVHLEGGSSGCRALAPARRQQMALYRRTSWTYGQHGFLGVLVFRETSRAAAGHRESRAPCATSSAESG